MPAADLDDGRSPRWLGSAAAALTAVAAAVGLVFIATRGTDTEVVPVTDVTQPGGATTTIAPDTSVTTGIEATAPASTTTAPGTTAVPQSTVTTIGVPDESVRVVTAGPDGVSVVGRDGAVEQRWGLPTAFALALPDGSLIVQARVGNGEWSPGGAWTPADTVPFIVGGPEVSATPLLSVDLPEGSRGQRHRHRAAGRR